MNEPCQYLEDFLDGSIDKASRQSFSDHLKMCEQCTLEIELAESLDGAIQQAWNSVTAPASLKHGPVCLSSELTQKPVRRKRAVAMYAIVAGIAALIGLVVYGNGILQHPINEEKRLSKHSPKLDEPILETETESPVIFSATGQGRHTILVQSPASNEAFTIVNAYPVVDFSTNNSP